MKTGTVKWFAPEKGFGFIKADGDGHEYFVHFSGLAGPRINGRRNLEDGQRVQFDVEQGLRGPQACNVVVVP